LGLQVVCQSREEGDVCVQLDLAGTVDDEVVVGVGAELVI
jgi:hypothetical protein